jgi:hypothetical protein
LFLQDTTFTVVVTALFLHPIYKTFREGGAAVQQPARYKAMLKTKWMTLGGTSLAVVSSTALYINMLLFFALGDHASGNKWNANSYLNISVFGPNLDSVLNDVGLLLVCGVLKTVDFSSLAKIFSRCEFSFPRWKLRSHRYAVNPVEKEWMEDPWKGAYCEKRGVNLR